MTGESRFPQGFLLIDKPNNRLWIYEHVPEGESPSEDAFKVRSEEPMEVLTEGPRNRYRAAEEPKYDVRAL